MKNNKIIVLLLIISLIISLITILLGAQCNKDFSADCSFSKSFVLLPDFPRNYEYIKYVASNFSLPREVYVSFFNESISFWHSPLYYYSAALLLNIANFLNINGLLTLQIFSAFLIMLANICFYFILRKLTKNKKLIIYALALFCFLPTHLFVSLFIGPDPLYYLFFILSVYQLIKFNINPNKKNAIFFGIFLALALFSRITAVVLIVALFIYILWLHLYKRYYERNLLFLSFLISLLGCYVFIRNLIVFGTLLLPTFDGYTKSFLFFHRWFIAFWGGAWGGSELIKPILVFVVVVLTITSILGLFIISKKIKEKLRLDFILIMLIVNIILAFHLTCNLFDFFKSFSCIGAMVQNRYLIQFEPFIAFFSAYTLCKIGEKNKYLKVIAALFILIACLAFAVDFISAFL